MGGTEVLEPARRGVRNLARVLLVCAVAAVLLEALTLVGAPLLTPFDPTHWRISRIAVFCVVLLVCHVYWKATFDESVRGLTRATRDWWARTSVMARVLTPVVSVAAALALLASVSVAATNVVGTGYDLRPPIMIATCVAVALFLVCFRRRLVGRLELAFLVVSLAFGVLSCVLMPPIAEVSWDGQIHFNSANAMSYVVDPEYTAADLMMTSTDAVVQLDILQTGDTAGVWNPTLDGEALARANQRLLELAESDVVTTPGTSAFGGSSWVAAASVGYIPNAVGLWLGRLLHLSCLGQYFLARLVSTTFYSVVFFLAIRRLRSGKVIVAALGLLPTPVLMAANFAYDPWCFALVTYSFARYVGALQSGAGIRRCDACAIFGAFFLGALVKAVIFPLLLVFLVAPASAFASRRGARLFRAGAVVTALALLGSFLLPFVASGASGGDARGGSDVSSAGQVSHVLSDPAGYLALLARFTIEFLSPVQAVSILNTFSGFPYLAAEPSRVAATAVAEWVVLVGSAALDRGERDRPYRGAATKVACVVGACCAFGLVVSALYVSFTPVGLDTVNGVQYRYLLPFLAVVFLVFANFGNVSRSLRRILPTVFLWVELAIWLMVFANVFVFLF